MGHLTSLRELYLDHNPLESIPSETVPILSSAVVDDSSDTGSKKKKKRTMSTAASIDLGAAAMDGKDNEELTSSTSVDDVVEVETMNEKDDNDDEELTPSTSVDDGVVDVETKDREGEEEEEEEEMGLRLAPPTKKRPLPPSLLLPSSTIELTSTPQLDIFSWLVHPEDLPHLSYDSSDAGSISMGAPNSRHRFRLHPSLVPLMGRARATRDDDDDDSSGGDDDNSDATTHTNNNPTATATTTATDADNGNLRFRHINVGTLNDDHVFVRNNVIRVTVWFDDEEGCGDYRFELINWSAHIRPDGDGE
jgi:hypothetical protein